MCNVCDQFINLSTTSLPPMDGLISAENYEFCDEEVFTKSVYYLCQTCGNLFECTVDYDLASPADKSYDFSLKTTRGVKGTIGYNFPMELIEEVYG